MTTETAGLQEQRLSLVPIFLIVLVDLLGMMMIVPLLPFYAQHFGASPFEIGLLGSCFSICQLVASPILGHISDRVGRKPVLIVSQIGTLLGFVLMAQATQLWMLFLARMIDGITAGNISLAQAYIADATEPKDRAKAFGVLGIALGIGLLLGPAFSGWLAGYQLVYPIYVAVGLSFLSILATTFLLSPVQGKPSKHSSFFHSLRNPALSPLLIQFFFYVFAFGFFSQGIGLFVERKLSRSDGSPFGPTEVGYLFAYCGLLGIIIQGGLIGRLVKRYGELTLVRAGFVADIVGYTLLGFAENASILVLGSTFFSYGNSTLRPTLTSLITQKVDREEQGAVLGMTTSLQSLGHILAPPLGGLLIQNRQLSAWAMVLAAVCAVPLVMFRKKTKDLSLDMMVTS